MKTLARRESSRLWDPFRELEEMHNRLSSLFGRSPMRREDGGEENITVGEWAPLVDISEDDKEYIVTAELPEVKKEDVKVTLDHGVLNIQGERKFEEEKKGKRYHRVERAYGSFIRSFTLPDDADPKKIDAEFKEGLLKVHIGKSEEAKPKSIEVKVS